MLVSFGTCPGHATCDTMREIYSGQVVWLHTGQVGEKLEMYIHLEIGVFKRVMHMEGDE